MLPERERTIRVPAVFAVDRSNRLTRCICLESSAEFIVLRAERSIRIETLCLCVGCTQPAILLSELCQRFRQTLLLMVVPVNGVFDLLQIILADTIRPDLPPII